jgi:hypothetical protein
MSEKTIPIRLPDTMVAEMRPVAAMKGTTPGALLAEAWQRWIQRHGDAVIDQAIAELEAMRPWVFTGRRDMSTEVTEAAIYEARRRTWLTLEPGVEMVAVTHRDSSDAGRAWLFFDSPEDAESYARRVLKAGPQGDHFHPAPDTLDLRLFSVQCSTTVKDWPEAPDG